MRFLMSFRVGSDQLVGAFDPSTSKTGLLIVSGGNEIAIGPQRAMARLAKRIADAGHPVLRFDRRGVGDSDGENGGWASSHEDIIAALKCLPHIGVTRAVAFGNCDAATALATFDLPVAARVLANPWLGDASTEVTEADGGAQAPLPPAAAIRAHYLRRIFDPSAWLALVRGRIDLRKLLRGMGKVTRDRGAPLPPLADAIANGLRTRDIPTTIVIAAGDATGIAFASAWKNPVFADLRARVPMVTVDTDRHGFTGQGDLDALAEILLLELKRADS